MALVTDVDIIAAALSGDRRAVITEQLETIEREIIERLAINLTTRQAIHELIHEVRQDILSLEPHEGESDLRSQERFALKEEFRKLVLRLADEQRDCWNDKQELKKEARALQAALSTLRIRDKRLAEFS